MVIVIVIVTVIVIVSKQLQSALKQFLKETLKWLEIKLFTTKEMSLDRHVRLTMKLRNKNQMKKAALEKHLSPNEERAPGTNS